MPATRERGGAEPGPTPAVAARGPSAARAFVALLALAAALRAVRIGQGFGYDEIYSLQNFFLVPFSTILTDMHVPNNHPLYSLLAHACVLALGESEWVVRLPAFLTGSLTPPVLYLLGRRLFSHRTGLLAGFTFAVGFWPLWQSADARGYAPMMLFSLLATTLFLDLRDRFSAGRAIGFVAASVAAAYSHLYGGFIVIGCAVSAATLLPSRPRDGLRLGLMCLAAGVISGLLYLPYLPGLISFAPSGRNMYEGGNRVSADLIAQVFLDWPLGPGRRVWSAPMWGLAAAGLWPAWQKGRPWLTIWLVAMAAGVLLPLAVKSFVFNRFYSFGLPGFFLLAAAGAACLWDRLDRSSPGLGALVPAVVLTLALAGTIFYFRHDQYPIRAAARWMRENAPDAVVFTTGLNRDVMPHYLPSAVPLPDKPIDPRWLGRAAVVVWPADSLSRHDAGVLRDFCRPPIVLPSSGERWFDVYIHPCGD